MTIHAKVALVLLLLVSATWAATPPGLINYQGVLRDSAGAPRNGNFDMVFRFYDLDAAGNLLLTDTHAGPGAVAVSNGLFTAQLGAGTITPGSEPNLAEMFRDNTAVWLEIQIAPDVLPMTPRVRVISSAYAQNAGSVQGIVNVDGAGHAGVGTTAPSNMLSVAGDADVSGSLGIGTAAPGYKLDVTGDFRATGSLRDSAGDAGTSGQILQSTGTGTNWVDPSAGSDADWTIAGNNQYSAVSGNVGIGTPTPTAKVDAVATGGANACAVSGRTDYNAYSGAGVIGYGTGVNTTGVIGLGGNQTSIPPFPGAGGLFTGWNYGIAVMAVGNTDSMNLGADISSSNSTFLNIGIRATANSSTMPESTNNHSVAGEFYAFGPVAGGLSDNYGVSGHAFTSGSGIATGIEAYAETDGTGEAYSIYGHLPGGTGSGAKYAGYFNGDVRINGALQTSSGDAGTSGQVLQSTGSGIQWGSAGTNADTLDGQHASYFLDASSTAQTKTGPLTLNASAVPGTHGVVAQGPAGGGYFMDSDGTGVATIAYGNRGVDAAGTEMGGQFRDWDSTGVASLGVGDRGIEASGSDRGGYFTDSDGAGIASLGIGDRGIEASGPLVAGYFTNGVSEAFAPNGNIGVEGSGSESGGYFHYNSSPSYARAWLGTLSGTDYFGIRAFGLTAGGYFKNRDYSGTATIGFGNKGIVSSGSEAGGEFRDSDSTAVVYAGYGNTGLEATGSSSGGRFLNSNYVGTAEALLATVDPETGMTGWGIWAKGPSGGGYFAESSLGAWAKAAYLDVGIDARGLDKGGRFFNLDHSGTADLAFGDIGVSAGGNQVGGYFADTNDTGFAWVGYGLKGIEAYGTWMGGFFKDNDDSGRMEAGTGDFGIDARGTIQGGYFVDDNGTYANVGIDTYKIAGTGADSFIQNHPFEKDRIIIYMAPEGDEAATYTRGTARLVNGEARVALGETFQWVTNPDIGLTAHLTPHGQAVPLAVQSLTARELIVVGPPEGAKDVVFDYLVYGLRIGFEEVSIVQTKRQEAFIPSMRTHLQLYAEHPDLQRFNSLERFKNMQIASGVGTSIDLTASLALRDAIHQHDPEVDGPTSMDWPPSPSAKPYAIKPSAASWMPAEMSRSTSQKAQGIPRDLQKDSAESNTPTKEEGNVHGGSSQPSYPGQAASFPLHEAVQMGDVLVMNPANGEELFKCNLPADPMVVGIAAESVALAPSPAKMEVHVIQYGTTWVKADATTAPISKGDLLVASPTPGHAMKAARPIEPGTVIGKALEPLDAGTGLIKVLVMLR